MTVWERLCWLGALWVPGPCSQGGSGQPGARLEMAARIPLFPSGWQEQYQPADRSWESQGTSLEVAFVQGCVKKRFYTQTT